VPERSASRQAMPAIVLALLLLRVNFVSVIGLFRVRFLVTVPYDVSVIVPVRGLWTAAS
jgi:hypothetical protein